MHVQKSMCTDTSYNFRVLIHFVNYNRFAVYLGQIKRVSLELFGKLVFTLPTIFSSLLLKHFVSQQDSLHHFI